MQVLWAQEWRISCIRSQPACKKMGQDPRHCLCCLGNSRKWYIIGWKQQVSFKYSSHSPYLAVKIPRARFTHLDTSFSLLLLWLSGIWKGLKSKCGTCCCVRTSLPSARAARCVPGAGLCWQLGEDFLQLSSRSPVRFELCCCCWGMLQGAGVVGTERGVRMLPSMAPEHRGLQKGAAFRICLVSGSAILSFAMQGSLVSLLWYGDLAKAGKNRL